jgi:hypothetical protein
MVPCGFALGLWAGVERFAREGVGRHVGKHRGKSHTAGDQKTVDAAELAQRGVARIDCPCLRAVKTHQ